MINTLKAADTVIKNVRRLSIQVTGPVYKSAARATLKRKKKHTEDVIKDTETSRRIISHAESEARQLLSKDRSLSVSREKSLLAYSYILNMLSVVFINQ